MLLAPVQLKSLADKGALWRCAARCVHPYTAAAPPPAVAERAQHTVGCEVEVQRQPCTLLPLLGLTNGGVTLQKGGWAQSNPP